MFGYRVSSVQLALTPLEKAQIHLLSVCSRLEKKKQTELSTLGTVKAMLDRKQFSAVTMNSAVNEAQRFGYLLGLKFTSDPKWNSYIQSIANDS